MVFSLALFGLKHAIVPEKRIAPLTPENIVFVVPCHNETLAELTKSLESLVRQTNIDHHRRAILVVCDGRVRRPGMLKTSAEHLLEDIFLDRKSRRTIRGAYTSWTSETCDLEVQSGLYHGVPYSCIIKHQNLGKRDTLICARSFLHIFNIRDQHPKAIFSPDFFGEMATFLVRDARMEKADILVGINANTFFADDCVSELLKESHYPNTVGVSGYVGVNFSDGRWNPWRIYQSAEYTISQGLRCLHQSRVTNKVSCLPGRCQLLKICEQTCGNKILYDLFGNYPKPTDGMLYQILATTSEDRNHACLMLSHFPKSKTRQALRAKAYTDVPQSWSKFLLQRRSWTLGATSNDLYLTVAGSIQWFEKIVAFGNIMAWFLDFFIIASIASLVSTALRTYHSPYHLLSSLFLSISFNRFTG
jgi:chitin synthase